MVLTSSCSVVYEGVDIENADENTPYANKPIDAYAESKILQEQEVLKANNGKDFLTVSIRPHGIFGPKDQVCHQMLLQAKKGLKFIIGFEFPQFLPPQSVLITDRVHPAETGRTWSISHM